MKHISKLMAVLLAAVLLLGVVGCAPQPAGESTQPTVPETTAPPADGPMLQISVQ